MSNSSSRRPMLGLQLRRARRHLRAHRWKRAAKAVRAGFARGGGSADTWVALGEKYSKQHRWDEAAQAYQKAVALDDTRPAWFAQLGRSHQRARRVPEAIRAYERAVALDDSNPGWFVKLAGLYERRKRWGDAARAYESATALDDRHPDWYAQLGVLYQRMDQDGMAEEAFRTWLDRDPKVTDLDRELLAASPVRLPPRRTLTRFVAEHLPEIRERARTSRPAAVDQQPKIFVYWGQGFSQAPPVVRRCQQELRRHHAEDEIVLLDDATVPYYVNVPPSVTEKIGHDRTKFSDVLRVALLAEYGGVWMDATILPTRRVLDRTSSLAPQGFFAFTYRTARISSWFLVSEPGGYMATMLREANYLYWEHFDRSIDYYYFHHLFEALYYTDREFRRLWDATPRQSSHPPHKFKRAMYQEYEPTKFAELMDECFVHKLSHKAPRSQVKPDTLLAHLVRDGPSSQRVARSVVA